MTAKEYFSELHLMKIQIERLQEQKQMYLDAATSTTAIINPVKVQISPTVDKMGDNVAKITDIEKQIDEKVYSYLKQKNEVINQIHAMNNVKYIHILFERYMEDKTLKIIAKEIDWSYAYVRDLHGKALKEFEEMYADLLHERRVG